MLAHYDVAIAGGGPAGAAAAVVLAGAGLRVLLADHGSRHRFKIGEGLPPSTRSLLHELGVLDAVLADRHRHCHGTLSAWGSDTLHGNDFVFQLHGDGLQLDRERFDDRLRNAAADAGAERIDAARLSLDGRPVFGADGSHLLLLRTPTGSHKLSCAWLIDAGGRPAVLARRLGARRLDDDRLLAFHLRLRANGDPDRDASTLVEAVEDGWWYSALLPDGRRVVAYLTDADLVDRRALLSSDRLWHKLLQTRHLRKLCLRHHYAPASAASGTVASGGRLDHCCGQTWFAIGDAALSFDPLSSKGIANALYSGLCAARALLAARRGDSAAAPRYDAHMAQIHAVYLEQCAGFYALEKRWPQAPFWRRRHLRPEVDGCDAN